MEGIAVPLAKVKPIQEKSVHKVIQTIDRFIIDLEQCCSNIGSFGCFYYFLLLIYL